MDRGVDYSGAVVKGFPLRRPTALAWALLLSGLAAFISLGAWQHGRAGFKRALIAEHEAAGQSDPVEWQRGMAAPDAPRFARVRVRGEWLAPRYLLDNQSRDGRTGVEDFAPLLLADGEVVLVGLGFLTYADGRRTLPPLPPVPDGGSGVTGLATPPPAHGLRLGGDWSAGQGAGPVRLMPWFDLAAIAADLGRPVAARVVRVDEAPGSPWRRDWRPVEAVPPERHLAYALQWWTMALAVLVIFLVVNRRTQPS
ncbi:MAG: SURF1 family protein [Xanthomonadales bacterium]|nr:SURF1 family protein [Xanthomonadales bacterium]